MKEIMKGIMKEGIGRRVYSVYRFYGVDDNDCGIMVLWYYGIMVWRGEMWVHGGTGEVLVFIV
jgi:hypothetical protein